MNKLFIKPNILSTEINIVEYIEENGIKINNTLEVPNILIVLNGLIYEYENYIINGNLSEEKKLKFAEREFNEGYKYKVIKNSLLQKLSINNKSKDLIIHFDNGTIQYIDKGLQDIDIAIHIYSLEIDLNYSVEILNILKLLEEVIKIKKIKHNNDFKLNFTILIGRAYIYLNKE